MNVQYQLIKNTLRDIKHSQCPPMQWTINASLYGICSVHRIWSHSQAIACFQSSVSISPHLYQPHYNIAAAAEKVCVLCTFKELFRYKGLFPPSHPHSLPCPPPSHSSPFLSLHTPHPFSPSPSSLSPRLATSTIAIDQWRGHWKCSPTTWTLQNSWNSCNSTLQLCDTWDNTPTCSTHVHMYTMHPFIVRVLCTHDCVCNNMTVGELCISTKATSQVYEWNHDYLCRMYFCKHTVVTTRNGLVWQGPLWYARLHCILPLNYVMYVVTCLI